MDEPADKRWAAACEKFGTIDMDIYQHFIKIFPEILVDDLEAIMLNWYNKNAREPYKSEMEFFANCSGVPLGGIVVINLVYDLTAACTSIIAEDENGVIMHGRNLDYEFMPLLRNATFNGHFTDNTGKIYYSTTSFFGYSGFWTGIKPGYFSISADERFAGSLVENVKAIRDDWTPPSWLIRDIVSSTTIDKYEDALNLLINTKLMAPVYFIIGGMNFPDGAVVTRNQTYSFRLWSLETSYLVWYDLETNYDWWTPPPKNDDRRDPGIKSMNAMGQNNLTANNLYNVLSTPPVLNDGTLYTTIMSASNASLYYAMVRVPKIIP
eukprot:41089_1